jgi:DNA polymerase-3 subunit delta
MPTEWSGGTGRSDMVAIKNREADRFLAELPGPAYLYLVFGTDAGLVAERIRVILARAVADPRDPFQLLRISGDDVAEDPLRLVDEANTIPLFGGKRAIRIDAQGKSIVAALEHVVATPPQDCTIVVSAGALKKDAALRKLFEREKRAVAIECYPDSAEDVGRLAAAEAAAVGLSLSAEAKVRLASLLGEDRLVTRSEIEKLILYARGDGEIGLDHVEAIVSEASRRNLDGALDAAFSGNFAALDGEVRKVASEFGDVRPLLAIASTHAMALHRAKVATVASDRASIGYEQGPPSIPTVPVDFRRRDMFAKHLRHFSADRLLDLIDGLAEATFAARRDPRLASAIVMRALWKVASAARREART